MSLLPINGDSENVWGTELLNFFSVFANANGTLKSPLSTQIVFVSNSPAASDANDGFSPYLPKATVESAVTALGGNPGVVQCLYGTIVMTGVVLAAGQTIRGLGKGATILKINTDAGTGHYGIDCSASQPAATCVVADLELFGPGNGAFTIGTAPANMTGIKTGAKARFVNLYVQSFYAGIEIASDHEFFDNCKVSNNFYNVYATGALSSRGNQNFIACDLTGATRASLAASGAGSYDSSTFIQTHLGFAPVCAYKEATTTNPSFITNSWCDLGWEAAGNACIYHAGAVSTDVTLSNVLFFDPTFGTEGVGGTYYDSGLPSDAAVSISGSSGFRIINDRTGGPGGATYIFKTNNAGSQSAFVTDRPPIAGEMSGNWISSEYLTTFGQNGPAARATVCNALNSITQGQVVQLQGQAVGVKVFGSDNTVSYVGVAAQSAASSTNVAVWVYGLVQVLCSEHITLPGVRLEIDPATPSQVRAINSDTGASFAPTTQVPYKYPVIGISNSQNSGTNTLIQCWLYPAPHLDPDWVHPGQVTSLPAIGAQQLGQLLTLQGNHTTTADTVYVALETAAATSEWVSIATATALTIGNGSATNLTALAKSTGTGPSSMAVVGWETVVIGANTYYRPLFQ